MDSLYFGLTKPELIEKVAGGDSGAQAELDRRAAKKAAKRDLPTLTPDQTIERIAELLSGFPIGDESVLEIMTILNDSLAGLPID